MFKRVWFRKSALNGSIEFALAQKIFHEYKVEDNAGVVIIHSPLSILVKRVQMIRSNVDIGVILDDGSYHGILGDFVEYRQNFFKSLLEMTIWSRSKARDKTYYEKDKHLRELIQLSIDNEYTKEMQNIIALLPFEEQVDLYNKCPGIREFLDDVMVSAVIDTARIVA